MHKHAPNPFYKRKVLIASAAHNLASLIAMNLLKKKSCQVFCMIDEDMVPFFNESCKIDGRVLDDQLKTSGNGIEWVTTNGNLAEIGFKLIDKQVADLRSHQIDEIWYVEDMTRSSIKNGREKDMPDMTATGNLITLMKHVEVSALNYFVFDYHSGFNRDSTHSLIADTDGESPEISIEKALLKAAESEYFQLRILHHPYIVASEPDRKYSQDYFYTELISKLDWLIDFVHDRVPGLLGWFPLKILCPKGLAHHRIDVSEMVDYVCNLPTTKSVPSIEIHTLKPTQSVSFETIIGQIDALKPETTLQSVEQADALNPIDQLFNDKIRECWTYLSKSPLNGKNGIGESSWKKASGPGIYDLAGCIRTAMTRNKRLKDETDIRSKSIFSQLKKKTVECRFHGRINYYTVGQGPPVFFLQTLLDDIHIWEKMIPGLCRHYKLILWQHRGLEDPRELGKDGDFYFGPAQRAHDIKEIIDHEGCKKINLISYCAGGIDAFYFNNMYMDHVSSLIFLSGPEYATKNQDKQYATDYMLNEIKIANMINIDNQFASIVLRTLHFDKKLNPDFFINNQQAMDAVISQVNPMYKPYFISGLNTEEKIIRYYKQFELKGFGYLDFTKLVDTINIPTFFIYGEYDRILNPKKIIQIARRIDNSKILKISAATHWIPLENHTEIIKPVKNFLAQVCLEN